MAGKSEWEDFLLVLLWGADLIANPSISRIGETFEAWERRHGGFQRRWRELERRKLIARDTRTSRLVYRLTTAGQTAVMGNVNIIAAWERHWDKRWRLILFDLPSAKKRLRLRLWRWLRANRFGYLQGSVWVRPEPAADVNAILGEFQADVEAFTIMETVCTGTDANAAIVNGAWDFVEINKRHQAYIQGHVLGPADAARLRSSVHALQGWLRAERVAWRHAISIDPLLPRSLWPVGYQGETAWRTRLRSFALLAK